MRDPLAAHFSFALDDLSEAEAIIDDFDLDGVHAALEPGPEEVARLNAKWGSWGTGGSWGSRREGLSQPSHSTAIMEAARDSALRKMCVVVPRNLGKGARWRAPVASLRLMARFRH